MKLYESDQSPFRSTSQCFQGLCVNVTACIRVTLKHKQTLLFFVVVYLLKLLAVYVCFVLVHDKKLVNTFCFEGGREERGRGGGGGVRLRFPFPSHHSSVEKKSQLFAC